MHNTSLHQAGYKATAPGTTWPFQNLTSFCLINKAHLRQTHKDPRLECLPHRDLQNNILEQPGVPADKKHEAVFAEILSFRRNVVSLRKPRCGTGALGDANEVQPRGPTFLRDIRERMIIQGCEIYAKDLPDKFASEHEGRDAMTLIHTSFG